MQIRHVVRVVLSGVTPHGQREEFTTIVAVSTSDRAAGVHLEDARFRADVRGLAAPWCVLAEYDVARVGASRAAARAT